MTMKEQVAIVLFVLLSNVHWDPSRLIQYTTTTYLSDCHRHIQSHGGAILLAEAKGVAGLGKAGGEGQGGADKAGQQVPPEVYMALSYAGTLFLFTLSVPLILYGLNKLLNKIEDCFGCGPSSRIKNKTTTTTNTTTTTAAAAGQIKTKPAVDLQTSEAKPYSNGRQQTLSGVRGEGSNNINSNQHAAIGTISGSLDQQQQQQQVNNLSSHHQHPQHSNENTKQYHHNNQRLHLQMLQQYPKYTQFISMSSPDYNPTTAALHVDHSSPTPPPPPLAPGNAYPLRPASGGSPGSRHTSANNSYAPRYISPNLNSMTKN